MTDVLVVSALKLGDPMVFGVEMVGDNFSLHAGRESLHRRRCRGGAGALALIEGVNRRAESSLRACMRLRKSKITRALSERRRDDKSLVDLCQ